MLDAAADPHDGGDYHHALLPRSTCWDERRRRKSRILNVLRAKVVGGSGGRAGNRLFSQKKTVCFFWCWREVRHASCIRWQREPWWLPGTLNVGGLKMVYDLRIRTYGELREFLARWASGHLPFLVVVTPTPPLPNLRR